MRTFIRVALAVIFVACNAHAGDITVMSSNAMRDAFDILVPQFEKATGHKVRVIWGGTVDHKKSVASGVVADLVIITALEIDALIAAGALAPGSRVDLANSIIGIAVRAGSPRPNVTSWEALKAAMAAANVIVLSSGPSSVYLLDLFEKRGLLTALRPKIRQLPPGQSVGDALARGDGDLGFTQVSEFLSVKGIDFIGPLSPDVQKVTLFAAGQLKTAPDAQAATAFLRFIREPQYVTVWQRTGLEPPR